MEAIIGLKRMQRKLDHIAKKGARRVARASAVGMAAPLRTAIRRGVNDAGDASGPMKKAARQTIGSSIKLRGGTYTLKVGLGVGKQSRTRKIKAHERNVYGQGGAKLVGGVGISATNIHWPVLGTKKRRTKSGKNIGRMPVAFKGVVSAAVSAGTKPAIRKAAQKAKIALRKEALKRR